jgi:AcrR family transcriptional regulator
MIHHVNEACVTLFGHRTSFENGYAGIMVGPTRREQQQLALRREVLDTALRQLDEGGPSAVNWRALARAVGVSPSTLYTYFENLDALHTDLIVEIYSEFATEVASGVVAGAEPNVRVRQAMAGYRRFATRHPARFTLVFTDVLPGYEAPAGGPTVEAQSAVLEPMAEALAELIGEERPEIATWSPANRSRAIAAWSQLHGFVSLEANHHLDWLGDLDVLFESTCDSVIAIAAGV